MTPEPPPTPESEPESKLPDLSKWWLALRSAHFVVLTREELDARRAEMAPGMFEQLDFSKEQERRIIALLKKPGCSPQDRKHLLDALESIRHCTSTVLDMITAWGLTRPPAE